MGMRRSFIRINEYNGRIDVVKGLFFDLVLFVVDDVSEDGEDVDVGRFCHATEVIHLFG